MDLSCDLVRGTVVPVVLSLLSDRAMYGYEIVKIVDARSNGRLRFKEGTLYPTLHRLEGDRWIKATWRTAKSGKPRKYYALTRRGRAELARCRKEWDQFSGTVDTLLMGA